MAARLRVELGGAAGVEAVGELRLVSEVRLRRATQACASTVLGGGVGWNGHHGRIGVVRESVVRSSCRRVAAPWATDRRHHVIGVDEDGVLNISRAWSASKDLACEMKLDLSWDGTASSCIRDFNCPSSEGH